MIKDPQKDSWLDIKLPGIAGLNTFNDPTLIEDNELAVANNVIYDGFLQPRLGSETFAEKPVGETNDPLQLVVAQTSDGLRYLLPIYGNHIYLWHPNQNWLRLNLDYEPDELDRIYGWVNWNNGRGDDRTYGCNGVDNFWKWHIAVSTVVGNYNSSATSIDIEDATRFPNSGFIVIKGISGDFTVEYTSKTNNTLNLSGTLGADVGNGASMAMSIEEMAGMEIGKVVSKHSGRLIVMNYFGGETVIWYSVLADPEDFSTGSTISDGGTETIADGEGEITGGHDFGEFFIIEKQDSLHSFRFKISEDLGSKLTEIIPIVSGQSLGPLNWQSTVKALNTLYYPTRTEGFISQQPTISGGQTGVRTSILSSKIQNLVVDGTNLDICKGVAFDQKILWAVALPGGGQNIEVLMYDLIKQAWSRFTAWAVQDWGVTDKELFYLDSSNGNIQQIFLNKYDDKNNPYICEAYTKRFDFGLMAKPKINDNIYLQGFITPASELFVDVLYNEFGEFKTQTFKISKDTPKLYFSQPLTNAKGQFLRGQIPRGGVILPEVGDISFFRCYLGVSSRQGYYNIQLRFYSNKQSFWGITGMSFNPIARPPVPPEMVIDPIVTS